MERTARDISAAQEKAGGTLTKFNRKFNVKRKRVERWHNITVMLAGELYEYGYEYRQINALLQKIRYGNQKVEGEHLLPCPFCGSKNISVTKVIPDETFNISCDDCCCLLYTEYTDKDKAVAEWNSRANIERT